MDGGESAEFRVEEHGHVTIVTIGRPETRNALTTSGMVHLLEWWARVDVDPDVRAIVLTGAADPTRSADRQVFCSGADPDELARNPNERATDIWAPFLERIQRFDSNGFRTPAIAAVNGHCIGAGLALLLNTDLRVVASTATFAFPEVAYGLIPTLGAVGHALADVPRNGLLELLLLGRRLDAARAQDLGLVSCVTEPSATLPTALDWAGHVAALPIDAVRACMDLVKHASRTHPADLLRFESVLLHPLLATPKDATPHDSSLHP